MVLVVLVVWEGLGGLGRGQQVVCGDEAAQGQVAGAVVRRVGVGWNRVRNGRLGNSGVCLGGLMVVCGACCLHRPRAVVPS